MYSYVQKLNRHKEMKLFLPTTECMYTQLLNCIAVLDNIMYTIIPLQYFNSVWLTQCFA